MGNSSTQPSVDPLDYGLTSRTILESSGNNEVSIVINRKSRLIVADAKKILEKVEKIKEKAPYLRVSVKTNAPVCSKSSEIYKINHISIFPI